MKHLKLFILSAAALFCAGLRDQFATANAEGTTGTHKEALGRLSDAAIARYLLVKKGTDNDHIAVAGSGDICYGVTADSASDAEERIGIALLGKGPTKKLTASEAMATTGVRVYAATGGKVALTGTVEVGILLSTAAADGDIVEVADYPPPSAPGVSPTSASLSLPTIVDGLLASGSVSNDFSGSTGTFKTSSGTNTFSGTGLIAANKSWSCASGSTGLDLSLGTGVFKSPTGLNTVGGFQAIKGITTPVAAAGSTVADAGQLGAANVVHLTSDSAAKGVKLGTGVAGQIVEVINDSSTAAELYAASGGTVNGLSADASVVIPASKGVRCFCTAADTWLAYDMPAKATAS